MARARLHPWQTSAPSLAAPRSSDQLALLAAEVFPGGHLESELRSSFPTPRPPRNRRTARSRSLARDKHLKVRERGFYPSFDGQSVAILAEPAPIDPTTVDPETGEISRVSMKRLVDLRQRGLSEISTADWDVAGHCEHPGQRLIYSAAEKGMPALKTYVLHPCRRCSSCRRCRAQSWYHRIQAECSVACGLPRQKLARTWLMTLTMEPEWHDHIRLRAIAAFDRGGKACHPFQSESLKALPCIEWEELPEAERFRLLNLQYHSEIGDFFGRVRKRLRTRFRYFCLGEKHPGTGGNMDALHWHLLLHEVPGLPQLKQDLVEDCWVAYAHERDVLNRQPRQADGKFGRLPLRSNADAGRICSMSVVRDPFGVGRYALKYCLKGGLQIRPYASQRYGKEVDPRLIGVSPERLITEIDESEQIEHIS